MIYPATGSLTYTATAVVLSPVHTSNNVEATGNKVGNKVACCFDNVASTLLLVWTGLYLYILTLCSGACDQWRTWGYASPRCKDPWLPYYYLRLDSRCLRRLDPVLPPPTLQSRSASACDVGCGRLRCRVPPLNSVIHATAVVSSVTRRLRTSVPATLPPTPTRHPGSRRSTRRPPSRCRTLSRPPTRRHSFARASRPVQARARPPTPAVRLALRNIYRID